MDRDPGADSDEPIAARMTLTIAGDRRDDGLQRLVRARRRAR